MEQKKVLLPKNIAEGWRYEVVGQPLEQEARKILS